MFENTTNYDKAALHAFADVCIRTVRRTRYRLHRAVLLVAGGICVVEGLFVLAFLRPLDYSTTILLGVVLVVGPCSVIKGLFLRRFTARKMQKNMTNTGTCRFRFDEDSFQAEQPGVVSSYRYDRIYKACEAPGYFILFLDKTRGSVVDMGGFTKGTADEFRAFLAEKTGKPVEYVSLQ